MTNNITPLQSFDFAPGLNLRSFSKDGELWFLAGDVCAGLLTQNVSSAVRPLDADEKGSHSVSTPGGLQNVLVINESGLYSLIISSREPAAKEFRKWVTKTVLPTLRRDGIYIAGQEKPITDDLTLPELMSQIAAIQAKVDAINSAKVRAWSRHQEEKEARSQAFRFFKGTRSYKPSKRVLKDFPA